MKKLALISLALVSPLTANATGESCNSLLNLGLYNVAQSSSVADGQSLGMSTFCSADYSNSSISSSQAASIEASYGLFSGGASGSASRQEIITKQSQLCTSGFNSSKYSNQTSNYSKTIYQGALDAWNQCQALANKGLVFSVQPSSTMQGVSVSITAPTGLAAVFSGVTQFGSGQSICSSTVNGKALTIGPSTPFKFTAASKVTINCTRQMQATGADLTADAQDLVFVTSADNLTVPLAAIGNFSRVTADKIKADIANAVAPLAKQTSVNSLTTKVNGINTNLQNQINTLVPSGALCGDKGGGYDFNGTYSSYSATCMGHDPSVDCPTGYSSKYIGTANQGHTFCVKN